MQSSAPAPGRSSGRGIATVVLGLVLLWSALAVVLYFSVGLSMAGLGSEPGSADVASLAIGLAVPAALVVLLLLASLRIGWARWIVAPLAIVLGIVGLVVQFVTLSATVEFIAVSLAAVVGGVLLLSPPARRWYGERRRGGSAGWQAAG